MIRSLINTALLVIAVIAIPTGMILLMAGATGPQDNIQNAVASVCTAIFGFIVMCLGSVAAAFPIGSFCRFISDVWDEQTARRRS